MGLEDGAVGVAGLDCIRVVLANESWCSFGNVDDDCRGGGGGGFDRCVGVVAGTCALGARRGAGGALALCSSNRDLPGCVWPPGICTEQGGGDRRLSLGLRQCQCGTAGGAGTGGSAGADA